MDRKHILSRIEEIEKELKNLKLQLKNEPSKPKIGDLVEILTRYRIRDD